MLQVFANASASGILDYDSKSREFVFNYTEDNPDFQIFGEKFLKVVLFSLNKNLNRSYKDAYDGIL